MTTTSGTHAHQLDEDAPSLRPTGVPGGGLRRLVTSYGGKIAWYAFAAALGFAVVTPIVVYFSRAFQNRAAAIRALPDIPGIRDIIITTILLAAGSTVIAAVFAVVLASLVLRVPPRYRGVAAFLPQLPLVVPPVAVIIGWIFIFAPSVGYGNTLLRRLPSFENLTQGPINVYSVPAIVLVTGVDLTGIVFAFVYARMHEISGALVAAARLSGASAFRAFMTVTLPLLRPSLVAGLVVVFLIGLGQFTAPLLLGSGHGIDVLTTEIFRIRESYPIDYAATAALGLPLLVIGLLSIVIQRAVVGDQRRYVTQASGRGMGARPSHWALVAVFAYGTITVALPVAAITLVAFSSFWNGDFGAIDFNTDQVRATLASPAVRQAVTSSVLLAVIAALIVLPLGFLAALAMSGVLRAPRLVQYVLDLVFIAPLAVPRAMLGLTVLYVFIRPPFGLYGTFALFVVGYVFIVLPFSLRSQHASLVGVHASLFEAARVSGASQFRAVLDIALPLTRRGMTAALAVMVILLSHDFAVSVMLRSPGNHVMGTLLYDFYSNGAFPQVAAMALIMTLVTGVLLALTLWIGGRSALENL